MKVKQAQAADIPAIMDIIEQGRAFLRSCGVDQWQHAYPQLSDIERDVELERGYVLENEGVPAGYAVLTFGRDEAYENIAAGSWEGGADGYAVIHRMAVSDEHRGKGAGCEFARLLEGICADKGFLCIRTDTHEDNAAMQRMLQRRGFAKRGTIFLETEGRRIGFEKLLARP